VRTIPDHAMPFLLVASFRGVVDELHARLADRGFPGLTARHGFAMQALGPGCTTGELAQRLGVSKQAAAKTAASLEALGFVTREPNPADARERILTPTRRGARMLAESGRIIEDVVAGWRARLGDADVDATLRTLAGVDHGPRSTTDLSDWL
jgi:DNA-binding MarR family transcriptional regulator